MYAPICELTLPVSVNAHIHEQVYLKSICDEFAQKLIFKELFLSQSLENMMKKTEQQTTRETLKLFISEIEEATLRSGFV